MSKHKKSKKQIKRYKRAIKQRELQKEIDRKRIENFKKQFPDTDFEYDGEEFSINGGMMGFSANMFDEQSYDQKEIDRIRIENFKKKFPDIEFEYDGEEFRFAGDPDDEFEFEKLKSKFPDVGFDFHEVEEYPRDPSEDFNTVTSTIHLSADLFD